MAISLTPSGPSTFAEGLWKKAVNSLSDEERREIDFARTDKLRILDDILAAVEKGKQACIERRWKYRKGDHDVIIRDKLEKIVVWINKFKDIGDAVVQYDPGHAALPWAGIRVILQASHSSP
jgi:vacuolar-type H+-ATPase subunit H